MLNGTGDTRSYSAIVLLLVLKATSLRATRRVRVVHCDGAHRVHHVSVRLRSESKVNELEEQVAEELGLSDTGRLVTMFTSIVDTSSVESIVRNPNEPFRIYMEDRIVVCKLPEVHSDAHELSFLPVVHRYILPLSFHFRHAS